MGRSLLRPIVPIALLLVLTGWVAMSPHAVGEADFYVLYRADRYPLTSAGSFFACHDLARPEIRCFDSWAEVEDDVARNFPGRLEGFQNLIHDSASPIP